MDPLRASALQRVLVQIQSTGFSLSDLVVYALQQYNDPSHPILRDLIANTPSIAASLYYHRETTGLFTGWVHGLFRMRYSDAVKELADRDNGWHFNAARTSPNQLRDFRLEDMARGMYQKAPELWELIQSLLGYKPGDLPPVGAETILDEEDADAEYWAGTERADDNLTKRARFANIVSNTSPF